MLIVDLVLDYRCELERKSVWRRSIRAASGAKTAAITGFAFWIFCCAPHPFDQWAFCPFPQRLLFIGTLAGLVEVILASVAGASPCKE